MMGEVMNFLVGKKKVKVKKSGRKNKQKVAVFPSGDKVHFGDPDMPEFPGTERGDNFCARSFGIENKEGEATRDNPKSANFWSREVLWNCEGKDSKKGKPPKRLI